VLFLGGTDNLGVLLHFGQSGHTLCKGGGNVLDEGVGRMNRVHAFADPSLDAGHVGPALHLSRGKVKGCRHLGELVVELSAGLAHRCLFCHSTPMPRYSNHPHAIARRFSSMKRTWCGMCAVIRCSRTSRVSSPSRE